MCLGLGDVYKTQALIQFDGPIILETGAKSYLLVLSMSLINDVAQHMRSYALPLMGRMNLNLLDFHRFVVVEQLKHTYTRALNFDYANSAAFPAYRPMTLMAGFIPSTPCGYKELLVYGTAQRFKPGLVSLNRRNQAVVHTVSYSITMVFRCSGIITLEAGESALTVSIKGSKLRSIPRCCENP